MARTTLRSMIDGGLPLAGIQGAAPVAGVQNPIEKPGVNAKPGVAGKKPVTSNTMPIVRTQQPEGATQTANPLADHVANHLQDPVGATREGFADLQQKNLDYELAKENMKRQIAPVKSVIQHVEDTHGLNEDEELGYQDPNDPNGMGPAGMGAPGAPGMGNNPAMARPGFNPRMPGNVQQQPGSVNEKMPGRRMPPPGSGPALNNNPRMATGQTPETQLGTKQIQKPTPKSASSKESGKSGKSIKIHVQGNAIPIRGAVGRRQMEVASAYDTMTSSSKPFPGLAGGKKPFRKADVDAGGPGSGCHGPNCGRHPDHGSFKPSYHVKGFGRGWKGKSGTEVHLGTGAAKGSYQVSEDHGAVKHAAVFRDKSKGLAYQPVKKLYEGPSKETAVQTLKERYGISHNGSF